MSVLAATAFGAVPARWPLPQPDTAAERWLRAVAAGGQGHYGCAYAELAELRRSRDRVLVSLAHSTQGSLLRQQGWHRLARGWDGTALLLAGDHPEARHDALVGLAADALGVGRFATSATLLEQARAVLTAGLPGRLEVRQSWVTAELAMARGNGDVALRHAERGVELAGAGTSVRHRIKSDVVLAAALCSAGRVDRSRSLADRALGETERYGLLPLRWALASLLAGIGSDVLAPADVTLIRERSATEIEARGGHWRAA